MGIEVLRCNSVAAAVIVTFGLSLSARAAGPDTSLVDAAKRGDRAVVLALLQKSVDLTQTSSDGSTALHYAAEANDQELVAALLKAGATPKATNRYGVQPISLAAVNGSAPIIDLLLNAGADANSTLPEGETVLMTAARAGDPQAVKRLLDAGANVNAKDASVARSPRQPPVTTARRLPRCSVGGGECALNRPRVGACRAGNTFQPRANRFHAAVRGPRGSAGDG